MSRFPTRAYVFLHSSRGSGKQTWHTCYRGLRPCARADSVEVSAVGNICAVVGVVVPWTHVVHVVAVAVVIDTAVAHHAVVVNGRWSTSSGRSVIVVTRRGPTVAILAIVVVVIIIFVVAFVFILFFLLFLLLHRVPMKYRHLAKKFIEVRTGASKSVSICKY